MVWSAIAGKVLYDKGKKKGQEKSSSDGTVPKALPQGMSEYYDDSWGPLLQQLQSGDPSTGFANVLKHFKGREKDLEGFMQRAAPFMASGLFRSPAYRKLSDFENLDQSMAAYQGGAGRIGAAAQAGIQAGQNQLARSGLGRSGAMAGLARQGMAQAGAQQGNLWSNLYQQHVNNTIMHAQNAFDLDRQITGMALGMNPQPRMKQPQNDLWGAIAGAAGGALGTALGGPLGGLFGGSVGNSVGGGGSSGFDIPKIPGNALGG